VRAQRRKRRFAVRFGLCEILMQRVVVVVHPLELVDAGLLPLCVVFELDDERVHALAHRLVLRKKFLLGRAEQARDLREEAALVGAARVEPFAVAISSLSLSPNWSASDAHARQDLLREAGDAAWHRADRFRRR
jgi:hypothetical protein